MENIMRSGTAKSLSQQEIRERRNRKNNHRASWLWIILAAVLILFPAFDSRCETAQSRDLYIVPNFHPACMGWLVKYSQERNYCLYTYLAHLDKVAKDPSYKFVFSEIPHLITMMEFEPERFAELTERLKQGRVEMVNAFVLEPTINLSGGEALVQQGVQGLRWYKDIMNLQPRYSWMIDTVGWHEQMAQIVSGLGLEAFVYCRANPTKGSRAIHWIQSPDGTRALALGLGHYYRNFCQPFRCKEALTKEQLIECITLAEKKAKQFPAGAPILLLGGSIDYSLPFNYENYPAELIEAWNKETSSLKIRMATLSDYMDVLLPQLRRGKYDIPVVKTGSSAYRYTAFWMDTPLFKQWYRRAEHRLQAAEAIATIADIEKKTEYPSQEFANSWLLMALNMDRSILWAIGVDGVFYDKESWDARDRFEYVDQVCLQANEQALSALTRKEKSSVALFNPVNWKRKDPFEINLPKGRALAGGNCQVLEDGKTVLAQAALDPFSLSSMKLEWAGIDSASKTTLPDRIETTYYSAKIDPDTGALVSLKLKSSGREMLSGPANVILAEQGNNPHYVLEKSKRIAMDSSSNYKPFITVTEGRLATIVEIRSSFHGGGQLLRTVRFYKNSRRIDFITETNNVPTAIISTQFPLADEITEVRRAIPYGFSHSAWGENDAWLTGLQPGRG
jgi:hypothetical protein